MGCFSNGTSFMIYEEMYCSRCVHHGGPDSMCSVMLAHTLHNYAECNKDDSILHLLIPRSESGIDNEQCTLFWESEEAKRRGNAVGDLFEPPQERD